MLTKKENYLGQVLNHIADEINITEDMYDKAVTSYESVGKWLGEGLRYSVKIMPQGSMNLGTVIKPLDDSDDYDMDLVCLLENGSKLSLDYIKNIVGDRLKEHPIYRSKLEDEGKRCWTMQYDEFHMDILPCVPKDDVFVEPYITGIKLTHKLDNGEYIPKYSDPYAYHTWFENRMRDSLLVEKRAFATKNKVDIEKVPTYRMRTPLQKAIQLLKRHRDACFDGHDEHAPISIIITTLAALAYNGETNLYEALCGIIERMPSHIELRGLTYWVENPVMSGENFAEKWRDEPIKYTTFKNWMKQVKKDLVEDPLGCYGIDAISNKYKTVLGKTPVERAIKKMGTDAFDARKNGHLYVNGLIGGITTTSTEQSKPVKEHTFFGK